MFRFRVSAIVIAVLLLVSPLGTSCAPKNFDSLLRPIIRPYIFNLATYEISNILDGIPEVFSAKTPQSREDDVNVVSEYFNTAERIKELNSEIEEYKNSPNLTRLKAELARLQKQNGALTDKVEKILESQIREVLSQENIFNPADEFLNTKIGFPPVNFKLEEPPHLLVISPRDKIESIREILLKQPMKTDEMESIEAAVDKLGVSSLVVNLGGLAIYPSFVTDDSGLRFAIDTAAEEWTHQYLAFKPLGFRYVLDLTGLARNYEVATMNETLASMTSKEIGTMLYKEYYPQEGQDGSEQESTYFDQKMREIRKVVDEYLSKEEIDQAEQYMEQQRQHLVANGYKIRKLNQAYFAFNGKYADRPSSISPIGAELAELRSQSASLKDFLNTVAAMTSRQDLLANLKQK